ncbi:SDF2 factor, partial [Hydrobates tethys]|nr:SDF2 factor [Oceanodroma tethys]
MVAGRRVPVLVPVLVLALSAAVRGGPGPVTCGSVVKLLNVRHNVRLHSHDVRYGSGNGTPPLLTPKRRLETNDAATGKVQAASHCSSGTSHTCFVSFNAPHRSHHPRHYRAAEHPEVSAFGEAGEGDYLDDWTVVCSGTYWARDGEVRFQHASTDVFLSVTGEQYGRPIHGQKEVHGTAASSQNNYWKVMEGIFMQPS